MATNTPVLAATDLPTPTMTFTAIPSLTPSATPITSLTASTALTGSSTGIVTPVTPTVTQPIGTSLPFASFGLDKLPRGTVYKEVRILNRSHAQMDISLHCTTREGIEAILEYGDVRNITIKAPEGRYVYVVYVGGRKIEGSFSLLHATSAVITVYKDHVTVR
jgi:hypothetical protein